MGDYKLEFADPLTKEEEYLLIHQAQHGCKESTARLLRAFNRILVAFADSCRMDGISRDEVLSEATFIFLEAIQGFDVGRGNRLSTHAYTQLMRRLWRAAFQQAPQHALFSAIDNTMGKEKFAERLADGAPNPVAALMDGERQRAVHACLASLENGSPMERQQAHIIRRHHFEHADWETIRNELALGSVESVKSRYSAGLRHLQRLLYRRPEVRA